MKQFFRRLRGVIKTGLTWAVGWAGLWGVFLLVMAGLGRLEGWDFWYTVKAELGMAGVGFIAGSAFGVMLSILERHKKLEDLSHWRIAMWGGLGGLALAAIFGFQHLPQTVVLTLVGVGSASGSVALARRGGDRKLIEGEDDPVLNLEGGDDSVLSLEGE
jgi:hypothetical protein